MKCSDSRLQKFASCFVWGSGRSGKLGTGVTTVRIDRPTKLTASALQTTRNIPSISCGVNHSIALCDNRVYAWGSNYYGACGQLAEAGGANYFGLMDDDDEVLKPTIVKGMLSSNTLSNTSPADLLISKVGANNFSSAILCSAGVITFGGGILGRGEEIYDSNPLCIPFFKEISRVPVDLDTGGDMSIVQCRRQCSATPPTAQEVYVYGYIQGKTGRLYKSLSPALVKHALLLDPLAIACAKGNGGYSGSGVFGIIGRTIMNDKHIILLIFGTPKISPAHQENGPVKQGFIQRWIQARIRRQELDNIESQAQRQHKGGLAPDYPFMRDVEHLGGIYADEPAFSIDLSTFPVPKDLALGEDFGVILNIDGSLNWFDFESRKLLSITVPNDHRACLISMAGGSHHQLLMVSTLEGKLYVYARSPSGLGDPELMHDNGPESRITAFAGGFDHFIMGS